MAGRFPRCDVLCRRVLPRLQLRGLDLVGEPLGQSPAAHIVLCLDLRVPLEQVADPRGLHSRPVVHAPGAERPGPQGAALLAGDDDGLLGVLPHLPRDEGAAAGLASPRTAYPDLRTIQSQLDALRRGIGEDIRRRAKPHVGTARHGEATGSRQRADLVDGPGDRAVVHAVEHGRRRVGELEAQDDRSSDERSVNTNW